MSVKAGRAGRRPHHEPDLQNETVGSGGKDTKETRVVPEGRAAASGSRGGTGDAKAVEKGRGAWRALGVLTEGLRRWGGGGFRLFETGSSNDGGALAEAANALDSSRTDPGRFFANLPSEGLPGDVPWVIHRVKNGEAAYLGDGEPIPAGQPITYLNAAAAFYEAGASAYEAIAARYLVAGMVEPGVGFAVEVKTGKGYFIIQRAKAGGTRFEEIKPGANFFDKGRIPLRVTVDEARGIVLLLGELVGDAPAPSSPVILPDISAVSKIPYGEKTQVDGRRVYDFDGRGNVVLDVQYTAGVGEKRLQATLYAAAGHSVVAPLSRVAMSGDVAEKWDLPITANESTFFVEVNGAPYLVTLKEEGGYGYVRVTFTH